MPKTTLDGNPNLLRRSILMGGAATLCMPRISLGQARETVRIGVPTKTYFPTIIAEMAIRQKLFEREGINPELTIYRSGAEGFEAIAAGAADLIFNSSSSVAAGLKKGVNVRNVANGALGYYGWHLVVKPDSPIKKLSELEGKKVGMTSAGSGSDMLARWTMQTHKVNFTRVPVGGGGLVPNLLTGNIDATVLYSPLTFQVMQAKQARSLIDFGNEVPPHSTGSWIATDKMINDRSKALQGALNAIYGGVAWLRAKENRDAVVKFLAQVNEITEPVAAAELDENIMNLSTTGEYQKEWLERSLEMAKLIGMTDLAPVEQIYTTKFRPVPTA
ncbi:MAG TPA: ABC transporter substrate-binding protein [Xanthobacteraceae bacterium]|nr:ABC transporter substrate-binding protein [Xanthobacteraceae bacterium]